MNANTVSKLITTKDDETNVEDVLKLHNYEKVETDEIVAELCDSSVTSQLHRDLV